MTSRLKRRLGDLGIDAASSKANESFCLIGTPLPPLEKSKDLGEFVPLWKQEVRDEKGRRRLHGAFTGGFSAGYFNTVGSKEGWAPSTFVSSRNDRAKKQAARPEDFMDEEDLQELKDSRKFVDTADEMDLTGGTQAELQGRQPDEPDSIASALEAAMLPAPKASAGARILKKMGWRLGQGIGPRVSLRQRRLQDMQAASGFSKHVELSDMPEEDEEAKKHKYAPRDTPVLIIERKDNFHGLGYRPGMGLNESVGVKGESTQTGSKISAGFGLGALNDADEDDLDVYDSSFGTKSGNRTAYDIGNEEDDRILIGSNSRTPQPKSKATSGGTFDDGTPILAGFVLSKKPVLEDRWFPLPDVPKDWIPNPKRVWNSSDKENLDNKAPSSQPAARMTADQRGEALGEIPLPSAPRSVFDFISQKDRERIKNIASGLSSIPPPPATPTIPHTDLHIASTALQGFQPFTSEPEKQARYTAYLQSQANPDSGAEVLLKPLPGQRVDEFNKELEDYAKAAHLFKPMSGAMAGRFTSAGIVEHALSAQEGLHQPSPNEPPVKEEEKPEEEEELSPKAHAAKMEMFGPLTREVAPWQPDRLLCKRFGVKEPTLMPTNTDDVEKEFSASMLELTGSGSNAGPSSSSAVPVPANEQQQPSSHQGPRDLNNIGLGEDETQGRNTLTYERPTMDVFKAIFASDDEDSDVGEDAPEDKIDEDAPPQSSVVDPEPKPPDTIPTSTVVDLSTFRPTFIRREGKAPESGEKEKEKEKKKKKKRDKEKKGALVSFAMDEEGGEPVEIKEPRKKKERRKGKQHKEDEDDDAMWVEKPPPDTVNDVQMKVVEVNNDDDQQGVAAGPARGRKRAIDFM